MRPTIEVDANH